MTATKLDLVKVEDWGLFTDTTKPIIIEGPCSAESEQQVFVPGEEPGRRWLFSAVSVLLCPYPPDPLPLRGRGETLGYFYARGFAPCIPGAEPGRRWLRAGNRASGGGLGVLLAGLIFGVS